MQPIAELVTVQTSPGCVAYRLYVRDDESLTAPPRLVWSNRAFADVAASHAGCRTRAWAWALEHGYRIVERREVTTEQRRRRA